MQKALLFSIILSSIVLPCVAARDASPSRGLRRALVWFACFNVCYLLTALYVVPRLP